MEAELEEWKKLEKEKIQDKKDKMNKRLLLVWILCSAVISLNAQQAFISTWKTDNPGNTNDNEITIPTFAGETYNYTVDWGDGMVETGFTGDATHTYATPGIYTVSITGLFPRISFGGGSQNPHKIITIEQWGNNPWTSMISAFLGCDSLDITNPNIDTPNLSNLTSIRGMFRDCYKFNGDISQWDVSEVEDMSLLFF